MEIAGVAYASSDISPGVAGPWTVERYELTALPDGAPDNRPHWAVSPAGWYTRLRLGSRVFMTDQVDEWWTQRPAITEAAHRGGPVLLTGLGLGLVAEAMFRAGDVDRIVVVERSADVIALVEPTLSARHGDHIEIVNASAFEWAPEPGSRFTVGWHDIWENPQAPECLPEEDALIARFAPYCDWQGTWSAQWRADNAAALS